MQDNASDSRRNPRRDLRGRGAGNSPVGQSKNRPDLRPERRADALDVYGTAGIIQNTWRELIRGLRARRRGADPRERVQRKQDATAIVGLELDPSHIAAAEVDGNGSISVKRGAVAPIRPGVLRDGEVADPQALSEALRALFAEHELPNRVRLGVANQRIVVRTLDLPLLVDDTALAAAVNVEAPDHIPMPMDEAVLDWQSLGRVETAAGPRTRVVVVAVRREMVELVRAVATPRGLARGDRPVGVRHGARAGANRRTAQCSTSASAD